MMSWTTAAASATDHMDFTAEYEKITKRWRLILVTVQGLAARSMMLMPLNGSRGFPVTTEQRKIGPENTY